MVECFKVIDLCLVGVVFFGLGLVAGLVISKLHYKAQLEMMEYNNQFYQELLEKEAIR